MIDFKKNWVKILTFLILLAVSTALLIIQVDRAQTATKLETTLISAIQFMLSIGFTWLLSSVVFENNQKDKQKKFAIAAFRRIKEIERNVKRTQEFIKDSIGTADDQSACLKVVHANLINAQDTIASSIYDWADVIEDEIELAQQIENLESRQYIDKKEISENAVDKNQIEQQIDTLSKMLPPTLRQTVKPERNQDEMIRDAVVYLGKEIMTNGCLYLKAFWEPKDSFMKSPDSLSVGDEVYIARGLTENRTHAVLVYDKDGSSIGVITNRCAGSGGTYDTFASAMDIVFGRKLRPKIIGGKPILAKVISIDEFEPKIERRYFKLAIERDVSDLVKYQYPELTEQREN